jgi:hypothetical protein
MEDVNMLIKLAAVTAIAYFIGGQRYAVLVLAAFAVYHVLNFACEVHSDVSMKMHTLRVAEIKKTEALLKDIREKREQDSRDSIRDREREQEHTRVMQKANELLGRA